MGIEIGRRNRIVRDSFIIASFELESGYEYSHDSELFEFGQLDPGKQKLAAAWILKRRKEQDKNKSESKSGG